MSEEEEAGEEPTVSIAGHEFAAEVDEDTGVPCRPVASILDEVGRESALADRIRQEAEAHGLDPEEADLIDAEALAREQERLFDLREANAELLEVASKALRGRYGWSASAVADLDEAELIDSLAIEEHHDPEIEVDVDLDAHTVAPEERA